MAYSEWKNAGINLIVLGTTSSFDLKTNYATYGLMATDYLSLTIDNFIIEVTESASHYAACGNVSGLCSMDSTFTLNKTYDSVTGVLNVSMITSAQVGVGGVYNSSSKAVPYKVYLKY